MTRDIAFAIHFITINFCKVLIYMFNFKNNLLKKTSWLFKQRWNPERKFRPIWDWSADVPASELMFTPGRLISCSSNHQWGDSSKTTSSEFKHLDCFTFIVNIEFTF